MLIWNPLAEKIAPMVIIPLDYIPKNPFIAARVFFPNNPSACR